MDQDWSDIFVSAEADGEGGTNFNLNGANLRLTTRYDNSYAYDVQVETVTEADNSTHFILKGGYVVHVIFELSSLLNFSYELVPSAGAYEFANASEKRIDLFAGSYVLHEARGRLADPTYIVGRSKFSAFLNRDLESGMMDILVTPFHSLVWASLIGLACALLGVGAFRIAKAELGLNLHDIQFQLLSVILFQDTGARCERSWSRFVLWITSIAFFIISAHFTSTLISAKTVNVSGIRSLDQLADSDYDIYIYKDASVRAIAERLRQNSTAIAKALRKADDTASRIEYKNFEQMMRLVQARPLAYVIDDETGVKAAEAAFGGRFPCSFKAVSFGQLASPWSMFMRKGSPYKAAINAGLLKLDQTGILKAQRRRWVPRMPESCYSSTKATNDMFISVEFKQLHFAFVVLFVLGLLGSAIVIMLEKLTVAYAFTNAAVKLRQ